MRDKDNCSPLLPLLFSKLSEHRYISIAVNNHLCAVTLGFTTELRTQIIDIVLERKGQQK
jgi:hypothetical protein